MKRKLIFSIGLIILSLSIAKAQLVVKETTNNVGIGMLDPAEKLEIHDGNILISGYGPAPLSQQLFIDVENDRAGFSLKADGPPGSAFMDNKAVFTMRNDVGDAVFSVFDVLTNTWRPGFRWRYIDNIMEIGGHVHALSFVCPSDKRLKSDIKAFHLGLAELMQLNPVSFNYNGKGGIHSKRMHVGILAQELQKVAPEFVSARTYKQFDKNQEKVLSEKEYLQIHDNEIKYLLINAIKDLKLEIDQMREDIAVLKEGEDSRLPKPENAYILQNIPNPGQTSTSIRYSLPSIFDQALLRIYSLSGQIVVEKQIVQGGEGIIDVDLSPIASGHYMYSLIVDGRIVGTKKMAVVK